MSPLVRARVLLTRTCLALFDRRMHRSRRSSYLGILALFAAVSCMPSNPDASGDMVGVYAINGALVQNTCGQAALPAVDPLKFEVEIRQNDRVGYWQTDKQPQRAGELDDDGTFLFTGEQTSLVSSMRTARNDLEPANFVSLTPDFDLKTTNCAMRVKETIEGSLARRIVSVDGGEPQVDDADPGAKHDLKGDNTIEISATPESDCSASLATYGGPFSNLPCMAHYVLSGELEKSKSIE
jgi:hypothetical protein